MRAIQIHPVNHRKAPMNSLICTGRKGYPVFALIICDEVPMRKDGGA